jgi:tetratricopeptide (TPR) repeat protein
MAKLARLPRFERSEPAEGRAPRLRTRYYAFLSYSHQDKELADWLHRELERFRVPSALAGRLTATGVVPRRLTPIFRDQHDLSAGDDLAVEIEAALAASQFLVVLCSPRAASSRWMNLEIESFKRTRPEGCVLAAVAAGEPFASDMPGREEEESFPPALRYKYDRRGHRTAKRAEPLAADFRENGEGRRLAFLKLVAGMLGVGLDELVQREQTRHHRRLALVAAASIAGMAMTSTLAVTAIQARDAAREQRRQAENLIAFMVGDLKDKLEPIGKLDVLDGVGSRVLGYYSHQNTSELTNDALLQRSRALSLMAEVAFSRGESNSALRLYREAMAGTAETVRRNPDDAEAIFEHAQNVFYVGQIAEKNGDFSTAEKFLREYQRLAVRMVALGPDNMKWRMEKQYADFDLGVLLYDQRRFAEAAALFSSALKTIEAISTADPTNRDYQVQTAESLTWLADALAAVGRYDEAIAARQRDIALLQSLFAKTDDVDYRSRLVPAQRTLAALYRDRGQRDLAIEQFQLAIRNADALAALEPDNAEWLSRGVTTHAALAWEFLNEGRTAEAANEARVVCSGAGKLMTRDARKPDYRRGYQSCMTLRASVALRSGAKDEALQFANRAIDTARSVHTIDPVEDAHFIARTYWLLGNVQQAIGNAPAARTAWTSALAAIPANAPEKPDETALHAAILELLGRGTEAASLRRRLDQLGYRNPEFRSA